MKDYYYENVEVVKVTDGDTFHIRAMVDIGFNVTASAKIVIRLRNIDTPEIYRPRNDAELKHGQRARDFCKALFEEAYSVDMRSFKSGIYGRWNADLFVEVNEGDKMLSLAEILSSNGFDKRDSYN